ncbi:MAG: hypothetical protein ACJ77N_02710 [Chloroflexota bacterium]
MPRRVLAFAGARRDVAPLRGRAVQAERLAEIEHHTAPAMSTVGGLARGG